MAYWLPDGGHFVDAFGTRVEEPSGDRTTVQRGGETIAVIEHRRTDEPLVEILGPTGLLAIDNERLRAEVLARLADLRSSRARIVAAADETRRRLERDLHDGAQQMLLALSYELRLAGLPDAVTEATAALGDLRDLADGLHPAILEEGGLAPALEDLAERARVPLHLSLEELDVRPDIRPDVRNTVYAVVVAVLDGAAGPLVLATTAVDGDLVVQVEGAMEIDRTHILDRVGALGGTLDVRDRTLRAVIPCAWSSPKTPCSPRRGIVSMLASAGIETVAEVEDPQRLLEAVADHGPDLVVVDIRMPPTYTTEGLIAAERILAEHRSVGVLVLSQYVEPSDALRLITERPNGRLPAEGTGLRRVDPARCTPPDRCR